MFVHCCRLLDKNFHRFNDCNILKKVISSGKIEKITIVLSSAF